MSPWRLLPKEFSFHGQLSFLHLEETEPWHNYGCCLFSQLGAGLDLILKHYSFFKAICMAHVSDCMETLLKSAGGEWEERGSSSLLPGGMESIAGLGAAIFIAHRTLGKISHQKALHFFSFFCFFFAGIHSNEKNGIDSLQKPFRRKDNALKSWRFSSLSHSWKEKDLSK